MVIKVNMVRHLKNRITLMLVIILSTSCTHPVSKIVIEGFNNKLWINDSLGCAGERGKMISLLKKNFNNSIQYRSKEDLLLFLGSPNLKHRYLEDSVYTYFIRKDRQCFDTLWRLKGFSDAEQVMFNLNKENEVYSITGPVYP